MDRAVQLHYRGFEIAQANQGDDNHNEHSDSPDVIPSAVRIVSVVSDNWEENMKFIRDANSSAQSYDFSAIPIPIPATTSFVDSDTKLVLMYPAGLFTVDRTKVITNPTRDQLAWWKTNRHVEWSVLMVLTDVVHLRTFMVGVYIITDFDELWATSVSKWRPLHRGWAIPEIDLTSPLVRRLLRERASSVRNGDFTKTKAFFPFPKKGKDRADNDNEPKMHCRYSFYVKPRSPLEIFHNFNLRKRMSSSHPFSCVNEDGVFEVFGDPVLKNIVCAIYAGAKRVTQKEILIGLRWRPNDREVPPQLWPYTGMMAIHWADFIITGVAKDIGPDDQQNFDFLWIYGQKYVDDPLWKAVRQEMYMIAERELAG